MPGAVLYREGSDEPLTIASAEAVADGPGWRVRFREIPIARGRRHASAAPTSRRPSDPHADLARGEVYWHEVLGVPVRGVDGAELGVVQDIYRVAENEVYIVGGGAYGTFDLPAVRAFIRIFAPRRGEIVVDAEALDLRPPKERRTDPDRPRAPRRTSPKRKRPRPGPSAESAGHRPRRPTAAPAEPHTRRWRGRRRGQSDATRPGTRRRPMTLEIDVLTLFPTMVVRATRREHPRPDPGTGPRHGPGPRPARVGARPPPCGRRHAVRRRGRHGHARRAGRRRHRVGASARVDRHPARPGGRGLPPRPRR